MPHNESQIRQEALIALSKSPTDSLTTSELIDVLSASMNPQGKDLDIIDGRSDTYFSQKVRNVVSHRNQGTGLVRNGLVKYDADEERLTLTAAGKNSVSEHSV